MNHFVCTEADITQVTHIMWIHCAIIHVVVIHVVVIQVVVIHSEVRSVEFHRQLNRWVWWGCIYSGSIYSMPSITFQSALFPMPELPINSDFWLRKLICLFNSFFRTTTIFIGNAMQPVCLFKSLFNQGIITIQYLWKGHFRHPLHTQCSL